LLPNMPGKNPLLFGTETESILYCSAGIDIELANKHPIMRCKGKLFKIETEVEMSHPFLLPSTISKPCIISDLSATG